MNKYLTSTLLAFALITSASAAEPTLQQAKQSFQHNTNQLAQSINQSIGHFNKKQQALKKEHAALLSFRGKIKTPQEKQCLQVMLQRTTNTQTMGRNMLIRLKQVHKQLPSVRQRAMKVQNIEQLGHIAKQGNHLLNQVNTLNQSNLKQAKLLNTRVQQRCAGIR